MKKFILLALSLILIANINSQELNQVIYYESTTTGDRADNYDSYHSIGHKFYYTSDLSSVTTDVVSASVMSSGTDYLVRVSRAASDSYTEASVSSYTSADAYLRFFFPEIDGTNYSNLPHVIFDVVVNCGCVVNYNIRYFKCDTEATTYYESLNDTDKVLKLTASYNRSDTSTYSVYIQPSPVGQFADTDALLDALESNLACESETGLTIACCVPYACWVDSTSTNCVCALDTTGSYTYNGYGASCWCSINSDSLECCHALGIEETSVCHDKTSIA